MKMKENLWIADAVEFFKGLFTGGFAFLLIGCAVASLKPGAEKITLSTEPAPKSCKFLTSLTGKHKSQFQSAMNDIRNQALDLGANYVQMENKQNDGSHITVIGNAYHCSTRDLDFKQETK